MIVSIANINDTTHLPSILCLKIAIDYFISLTFLTIDHFIRLNETAENANSYATYAISDIAKEMNFQIILKLTFVDLCNLKL